MFKRPVVIAKGIGIVLSVIWLVLAPLEMVATRNGDTQVRFERCLESERVNIENLIKAGKEAEAEARGEPCVKEAEANSITLGSLLKMNNTGARLVWAVVLVPLVLFWIIGAAVVRWIGRRFNRQST
jgi:hypothetical protein